MGGHRRRMAMLGAGAAAATALALGLGPLAGTAGAQEICTPPSSDPNACVSVNGGFGVVAVLVGSPTLQLLTLDGVICNTTAAKPTYVVYGGTLLLGKPVLPLYLSSGVPCS